MLASKMICTFCANSVLTLNARVVFAYEFPFAMPGFEFDDEFSKNCANFPNFRLQFQRHVAISAVHIETGCLCFDCAGKFDHSTAGLTVG